MIFLWFFDWLGIYEIYKTVLAIPFFSKFACLLYFFVVGYVQLVQKNKFGLFIIFDKGSMRQSEAFLDSFQPSITELFVKITCWAVNCFRRNFHRRYMQTPKYISHLYQKCRKGRLKISSSFSNRNVHLVLTQIFQKPKICLDVLKRAWAYQWVRDISFSEKLRKY